MKLMIMSATVLMGVALFTVPESAEAGPVWEFIKIMFTPVEIGCGPNELC